MFDLKRLSPDGVAAALEKGLRYRLLNEPSEAESICQDVLCVEPANQDALVLLLLAITDRFDAGYAVGVTRAQEILPRLTDDYERAYYSGIVAERRGKATLNGGRPGADSNAYLLLREAMGHYERAEKIRPTGNDDAVLRWNACARIIMENHLTEPEAEPRQPVLQSE